MGELQDDMPLKRSNFGVSSASGLLCVRRPLGRSYCPPVSKIDWLKLQAYYFIHHLIPTEEVDTLEFSVYMLQLGTGGKFPLTFRRRALSNGHPEHQQERRRKALALPGVSVGEAKEPCSQDGTSGRQVWLRKWGPEPWVG